VKKETDKRNEYDGLVHKKGKRYSDDDGQEVEGVNAYSQKHH